MVDVNDNPVMIVDSRGIGTVFSSFKNFKSDEIFKNFTNLEIETIKCFSECGYTVYLKENGDIEFDSLYLSSAYYCKEDKSIKYDDISNDLSTEKNLVLLSEALNPFSGKSNITSYYDDSNKKFEVGNKNKKFEIKEGKIKISDKASNGKIYFKNFKLLPVNNQEYIGEILNKFEVSKKQYEDKKEKEASGEDNFLLAIVDSVKQRILVHRNIKKGKEVGVKKQNITDFIKKQIGFTEPRFVAQEISAYICDGGSPNNVKELLDTVKTREPEGCYRELVKSVIEYSKIYLQQNTDATSQEKTKGALWTKVVTKPADTLKFVEELATGSQQSQGVVLERK